MKDLAKTEQRNQNILGNMIVNGIYNARYVITFCAIGARIKR